MKSAGKWIELENEKLSEITLAQKDKCHVFSLICGSEIPVFRCEFIIWSNHRNQESKKRPLGREGAQERKRVGHRSVVSKKERRGGIQLGEMGGWRNDLCSPFCTDLWCSLPLPPTRHPLSYKSSASRLCWFLPLQVLFLFLPFNEHARGQLRQFLFD